CSLTLMRTSTSRRLDWLDSPSLDPCLCCGCRTGCTKCPACLWTPDGRSALDIDAVHDGPNGDLSLREARLNYAVYRACHRRYRELVRAPRPGEPVGVRSAGPQTDG